MDRPFIMDNVYELAGVRCPCGFSRRGLERPENDVATLHVVDISEDAREHYHKNMSEIYFVLDGEGEIVLDGENYPVKPGSTVLINAGTRHKARGKLRVIVVVIPPFDPEDEFFD